MPSVTFDAWFARQPKLNISVCKIDVEGYEAEVFAGMEQTLSKQLIAAFVLERHVRGKLSCDPIFTMLVDYGYRMLRIEKGFLRVRYVDIDDPPEASPTADFVAVLHESSAERRLGLVT